MFFGKERGFKYNRYVSDTNEKKTPYVKPTWDEYFLKLTEVVGTRGTCDRGRSGCVVARDKRILATGYVGAPAGLPHCDDVGHEMHVVENEDGTRTKHCIRTTHAEQNAIVHAARVGTSLEGGVLYCRMTPCYACAKMIINAGIVRVVCMKDYHSGNRSKEVFREAGVQYEIVSNEVEAYADTRADPLDKKS